MAARLLAIQLVVNVLLMVTAVNIPVQPNLDLQRVSGRWLPITVAHRGRQATESENENQKSPFTLTPSSDGKLEVKFHVRNKKKLSNPVITAAAAATLHERGGLWTEKKYNLEPTKTPGVFSFGGNHKAYVVETDYRNYLITATEKNGFSGLFLAGRLGELGADIKEKHKKLALSLGFPADRIRDIKG